MGANCQTRVCHRRALWALMVPNVRRCVQRFVARMRRCALVEWMPMDAKQEARVCRRLAIGTAVLIVLRRAQRRVAHMR
jgi:hypothetical protein